MNVLLVEDSKTVAAYIRELLKHEPDLTLQQTVTNGPDAVAAALNPETRPDVILLDLQLPGFDGLEVIRRVLREVAIPVVVLSGLLEVDNCDRTYEAFAAGAVEVLAKPVGLDEAEAFRQRLVRTLRTMEDAHVVRRRRAATRPRKPETTIPSLPAIVAIGASTGGPAVLYQLLDELPAPYPLPIIIAQHISPGFDQGLAQWLSKTGHRVTLAQDKQPLRVANVYLAQASKNVRITSRESLRSCDPGSRQIVPSCDELFESAAVHFGSRAVGILLTGMGRDGAAGMLKLREVGAITVTQEGSSCTVNGMPEAARHLGAVMIDVPPGELAPLLQRIATDPSSAASQDA